MLQKEKRVVTIYNRNSEWIRLRPNPLGIANVRAKPNISVYLPVTDGYTNRWH